MEEWVWGILEGYTTYIYIFTNCSLPPTLLLCGAEILQRRGVDGVLPPPLLTYKGTVATHRRFHVILRTRICENQNYNLRHSSFITLYIINLRVDQIALFNYYYGPVFTTYNKRKC